MFCGTRVGLGGFVVEALVNRALGVKPVTLSVPLFAKLLLLLFPNMSTLCGSILLPFKCSPILKISLWSFLLSMSLRSPNWKCWVHVSQVHLALQKRKLRCKDWILFLTVSYPSVNCSRSTSFHDNPPVRSLQVSKPHTAAASWMTCFGSWFQIDKLKLLHQDKNKPKYQC